MTFGEIQTLLETTGLPVAYRSFPEKDAPVLPFICYLNPYDNNFAADGIVYSISSHIVIELYVLLRDSKIEEKVERAISIFYYTKDVDYLEEEKCYKISYELEV